MTTEKDYVLGTHDEEIQRLRLQHRVSRPRVSDAYRESQSTPGAFQLTPTVLEIIATKR